MSRIGRKCTVCQHRESAAINLALARRVSVTAIAKRSGLQHDALYRHAKAHLPAQLRAKLIDGPSLDGVDLDKLRETESQSLLLHLVAAISHLRLIRLLVPLNLLAHRTCGEVK